MNKGDFIDAVQQRADLKSKAESKKVVEAVFGLIQDSLKKGEDVNITGFGKFTVTRRAARMGVNPQTGEKMEISASTLPKFRAGKSLKEVVK